MQVIPAVDVLDGAVVRLARGVFEEVTRYARAPLAAVEFWGANGATLVHVVDLAAARDGCRDPGLVGKLSRASVPVQLGGGIRSAADAGSVIGAGASRVVVGTSALWSPEVLGDMVATVGAERLTVALDVRAGRAVGAGWLDEGLPLEQVAARVASQGVTRALVTGIERDGMMSGPALDVLSVVRKVAPTLALLGSGGVGSLDDLRALRDAGAEGAIVGRALYEGRFTLQEAVAAAG